MWANEGQGNDSTANGNQGTGINALTFANIFHSHISYAATTGRSWARGGLIWHGAGAEVKLRWQRRAGGRQEDRQAGVGVWSLGRQDQVVLRETWVSER